MKAARQQFRVSITAKRAAEFGRLELNRQAKFAGGGPGGRGRGRPGSRFDGF
jgi:hypothetical protein